MSEQASFKGFHVLVVEDMYLVALDLADQLADLGCVVVGPAASVKQAFERIDGVELDGAILDVNLAGERSFPIAEWLASRGIPFVFLTGYDSVTVFPPEFLQIPRLAKPLPPGTLAKAVATFCRSPRAP